MTIWKDYYRARSITDALQALASAQGPARIMAGGTDLLLDLQQERIAPLDRLVDISSIPELQRVELRTNMLFIGAAVPLSQVVAHPLVREHAQALVEAGSLIGGPQVRNQATLGGNVAHALPAADGSIALLAHGAQAEIASLDGTRLVPIQAVYAGPGRTALRGGLDLLVGFVLPLLGRWEGAAFRRVMRPQGVALPVLNLAAWVCRDGEQVKDVRIAMGPAGPVPFRALETESLLRGKSFDPPLLNQAIDCLQSEAGLRTSRHRATRDYRTHLVAVLLSDVLTTAWERAAQSR